MPGRQVVTLIPGDGIGPEVAEATVRAVAAAGAVIEWERVQAGSEALARTGRVLPDDVLQSVERNRVALKGPLTTPVGGGHPSVNVALRKAFELYANFRPVRLLPGVKTRFSDLPLDMVIFRENTEGLYSGLEHEVVPGVVESLKIITEKASLRIARAAFRFARQEGRKKISVIHKANIMKMSDGLFLKCARQVAGEYPEIGHEEWIVDNTCLQLVMRPETFDVLLLENLYGDIISDLCAGLVGGLGLVPAANLGDTHAIFEAVHGSAPDIAGRNVANPTALMQSAVLMLLHLGQREAAARLRGAIERVYAEGRFRTRDLGGSATTTQFAEAVIAAIGVPAAVSTPNATATRLP
jgi:isocitrate dehydrogenase (NAD+)